MSFHRKPIEGRRHHGFVGRLKWCREGGSNPHDLIRVGGF
jgi:hypothetical protein